MGRPGLLNKVLAEHRRWESMPNRREPVTKSMLNWMLHQSNHHDNDTQIPALTDWALLALFFGFRLSKFLQLHHHAIGGHIKRNKDGLPQAFILSDITFYGQSKKILQLTHNKHIDPNNVSAFSIRWRYQKNQQNGETKIMVRNDANPRFCAVRAMLRICHRAALYRTHQDQPLAIYRSRTGSCKLLTHK